jgi:hypothetical protein
MLGDVLFSARAEQLMGNDPEPLFYTVEIMRLLLTYFLLTMS